jgi:hypothetical protein
VITLPSCTIALATPLPIPPLFPLHHLLLHFLSPFDLIKAELTQLSPTSSPATSTGGKCLSIRGVRGDA